MFCMCILSLFCTVHGVLHFDACLCACAWYHYAILYVYLFQSDSAVHCGVILLVYHSVACVAADAWADPTLCLCSLLFVFIDPVITVLLSHCCGNLSLTGGGRRDPPHHLMLLYYEQWLKRNA